MSSYPPHLQDAVLESYKRMISYASDQIAHYEHFMDHMLPFIVREYAKFEVPSVEGNEKQCVQLKNVVVRRPNIDESDVTARGIKTGTTSRLMPIEARNRGLTYSAQVLVDIEHSVYIFKDNEWISKGETTVFREMPLFEIPVMLRSKYCWLYDDASSECWMDMGGYFIVRGNAKVLQPQKVQRNNMHLVKGEAHVSVDMDCRSRRDEEKFRSTSTLYMNISGSPPLITVNIPFLKSDMPIVAVFRMLGIHSREEIEESVWGSEDPANDAGGAAFRLFAYNFSHPLFDAPFEDILDAAGSVLKISVEAGPEKVRRQVIQQVAGELLPHMGFDDLPATRVKKIAYLAIIARRMLNVYLGRVEPDDRDFEGHKSVQMSAGVLSIMFRQQFAATMKLLRNRVYDRCKKGKHLDISALMSDALSRDVLKAFTEGEVTVQKDASNAGTSVIQMAQQVNPLGLQTHIQRVSTALKRDGKYKLLRMVDGTQLHVFCPTETPDGHGCGLLQNLATFARVRLGAPLKFVESAVLALKTSRKLRKGADLIRPFTSLLDLKGRATLVFVNSDPIGVTDDVNAFVESARAARRTRSLPFDCSIVRADHGVCISSDMGVVVFPLLHLQSMKFFRDAISASQSSGEELWSALCRLGIVEYIDAYELLEYRVAFSQEEVDRSIERSDEIPFTHMAVHPSGFFGTSASSVPYADHDQAPRVAYQAGMVKQAISTPAANLRDRMDMGYAYELWYPQAPMADTAIAKATKMNEWPMGENLMIAIAPFGGWSQEDSIIRNRASVDRGSGRITVFRVFKATCRKRTSGDIESFEHPFWRGDDGKLPKCEGLRGGVNYDKIGFDGFPEEGTPVKNGDVIIGRVSNSSESFADAQTRITRRDRSVVLVCEASETFYVDRVMLTVTKEGARSVRVRLRSMRVPQEGDKISSRHGQKGTLGILLPEEDLPFVMSGNNAGMRPDAIINLHR